MANGDRRENPRNADQLRSDIDHGRTGDKVNFPDPAAAPLGTDAEAGGASLTPHAAPRPNGLATGERHAAPAGKPGLLDNGPSYLIVFAIVMAMLAAVFFAISNLG